VVGTVQTVVTFFNRHVNYNFQFCNSADRRGHCKSGVPDNEQDGRSFQNGTSEVFGVPARKKRNLEDETLKVLGAKLSEGLGVPSFRHETFESLGSVGINNLEFVRWEEEQDVLPGSHTSESDSSACLLYSPTVCRRGGVGNQTCKDHDVSLVPPRGSKGGSDVETRCGVEHAHFGSSIVTLKSIVELVVLHCC